MTPVRQGLGLLGLLVAVAGIATGNRVVVWVAIGLLAASLLFRVLGAMQARRQESRTADQ